MARCLSSHLSSLANSRCWYGVTPMKLLQDLGWQESMSCKALPLLQPKWNFLRSNIFSERDYFWKCPRGERDFLSLQPVVLGLGVERWAKWSLPKGSSIPVSFHELLQRIWGHRREKMWHECRNTSTQRWVNECLWLLWLSDTSVDTESRAALCSVVQVHPLLIIFFLLKFTVEKNMQSFLVLKWIGECFCRCLCCWPDNMQHSGKYLYWNRKHKIVCL